MGFVKYEQKEQYAIITIDREKALNALNSQVLTDLDENVLADCAVNGENVAFSVPAYTIAQVKIYK